MADWKDNKGAGPWDLTSSNAKWGYLNNPLWSRQQDAIDSCEDLDLPLDLSDQHKPCGHWHKLEVSEEKFPSGKWVAAMQQPGTPYIYVYDILQKAVIRIDTSEIPVFVSGRLELDSAYRLNYDMGTGNPGAQRGGYCMNKDGTKIWYLFNDQMHWILADEPDAQLIEVDISKTNMSIVKKTLFPGLLPLGPWPNIGRIKDACSDDTHTYWCTDLIAGRIIKIRNSDHSIVDDHYFNYPLECGGGGGDEPIETIDVNKSTGKLYWVYCRDHLSCAPSYNACRHLVRANLDLTEDENEVICGTGLGTPEWQNMIRIYSNHVLHHRAYHPFSAPLMKRDLGFSTGDIVEGTNSWQYACIKYHVAALLNRPISGADYLDYWGRWSEQSGGDAWQIGKKYRSFAINQGRLQNIFGVRDGKLFTLMHIDSTYHEGFLYCIDFSGMTEISKLDVSYYTAQGYFMSMNPYDWDWTSVSAMNRQTGVIAIFRYNNVEERNYVGCFDASPSLGFLCDVSLHSIRYSNKREILNEPISWPFEGFTPPPIPSTDPPVEVIVPPGGSPGPGEILYVPPPPPPEDAPDDGVTLLQSGFVDYNIYVGPGQTLFFKIVTSVPACVQPIQVGNTPQTQQPHTVHLLIKKGSKPTIADFNRTWEMAPSDYDCTLGLWLPAKPGAENLYWKYNTGSQAEYVQIREPMASDTYYIMLYNNGLRSVRNQRLTISYSS